MSDTLYGVRLKVGELEFEAHGDKEFVEKHMGVWKADLAKDSTSLTKVAVVKKEAGSPGLVNMDLVEFYNQKKPGSQNEMIATFGAYFKDYENRDEFDHKSLLEAFDKVRINRPRNIHDALSKCYKRSDYIIPAANKKGFWRLAQKGIDKVAALPEAKNEK